MNELQQARLAIERIGLHGDALRKLVYYSRNRYLKNKKSVISYALWNAMMDVFHFFDDNQGIEIEEANRIGKALKRPICDLLHLDILHCNDDEIVSYLSEIIEKIASLK